MLPASSSTRMQLGVACILVAAGFFALSDFLLLQRVFHYFDFEVQWMPFHQFVHVAWESGQSALWNPYIMLGFPQHGEGQAGIFYPVNLLLRWIDNQPYAISVSIFIHDLIALGSTYLLARALGLRRIAALHGAMCFGFSAFFFAELTNYNISLVAAYLPLKIYLITRYFQRRNSTPLLLFALASGAELLISHVHMSFITNVSALLYFIICTVVQRDRPLRDMAHYAAFMLLAIGLACIQLIPTLEFVGHTERAGGISYEMITSYSQSFTQYLTIFFPMMHGSPSLGYSSVHSFEEQYFFVGSVGILLALFGIAALAKRRDQRYLSIVLAVGLIGFILSLGANNPFGDVYRLLMHVPGFNLFRAPARWSILPALALAMASAYGLQVLIEHMQWRRTLRALLLLCGVTLAAPLLFWLLGWQNDPAERVLVASKITHALSADLAQLDWINRALSLPFTLISPLAYLLIVLALIMLIASLAYRVPARRLGLAIVALGFIDLMMVIKPANPRAPADFFANTPAHIAEVQARAGHDRVISPDDMPNMESVNNSMGGWWGVQSVKGYSALRLNSYIAIADQLGNEELREALHDYLGVRYEIKRRQTSDGSEQYFVAERSSALPRAFMLPFYSVRVDDANAWRDFLALDAQERTRTAVISARSADLLGLSAMQSFNQDAQQNNLRRVRITAYENARVQLTGHSAAPGFVVLTDMFYPGWVATVNGKAQPIVPVQGSFRGIYLREAGPFNIEMRYQPRSLTIGATISGASLLLAALIGTGLWRRKRRIAANLAATHNKDWLASDGQPDPDQRRIEHVTTTD